MAITDQAKARRTAQEAGSEVAAPPSRSRRRVGRVITRGPLLPVLSVIIFLGISIGIITGSGTYSLPELEAGAPGRVATPFGDALLTRLQSEERGEQLRTREAPLVHDAAPPRNQKNFLFGSAPLGA